MNNFVRFKDAVNFTPPEVPQKVKDYYTEVIKQGLQDVRPLRIKIAATHAGKVTRNNGFYLPHKMRDGAETFIAQYPKPIQVHHEEHQDPIGRVIDSKYVDTSALVRDSIKDTVTDKQTKLIDNFTSGDMSFDEIVDFANEWIINDLKISTNPDYEGLGYIEIVANITDPDAIQKILDGRYLTGSVGATTNQAVCSVCKQDWAADGKCEHRPGKIYDDVKCVIIAGNLSYDEYSFVNRPADRHSRVIEINVNGIQDFVSLDEDLEISLIQDNNKSGDSETKIKDNESDPVEQEDDPIRIFFGDEYEDIVGEDEWGEEYAKMLYGLLEDVSDPKERDKITVLIHNAKLSSKQRKSLPGSSFCGPDRSFPVNDCAHYTAALRLIGKYKGPGDKSRIRSCIERKGKRLGCTSNKKDSVMMKEFTVKEFDHYQDEELIKMFDALREALKERKIDCGCDENKKIEEAVQKAKEQANTTLQDENKQLSERLENLRKEVRYLHGDIEGLTNQVADKTSELRDAKVHHVVDMRKLTGKECDFQAVSDELKEKSSEDLDEIIKDIASKVDTQKIADTLNSGLSNNPSGTVEDPVLKQDTEENKEEKVQVSDATKKSLKFDWLRIRTSEGQEAADNWLSDVCKTYNIDLEEIVPVKEQS